MLLLDGECSVEEFIADLKELAREEREKALSLDVAENDQKNATFECYDL